MDESKKSPERNQIHQPKIFKKYIEIELQLGNIDRCRKLYKKFLEWSPENCYAWCKYAELERSLSEAERTRAIFELAIAQPALDMPELLWKAYIYFEISEREFKRTRQLYERLLERTKHLKVWISYAKCEASAMEEVAQEDLIGLLIVKMGKMGARVHQQGSGIPNNNNSNSYDANDGVMAMKMKKKKKKR